MKAVRPGSSADTPFTIKKGAGRRTSLTAPIDPLPGHVFFFPTVASFQALPGSESSRAPEQNEGDIKLEGKGEEPIAGHLVQDGDERFHSPRLLIKPKIMGKEHHRRLWRFGD